MVTHGRKGDPPSLPKPLPAAVIDTHTHLDACGFTTKEQVIAALDRAESVGVAKVITVADDIESARWVVEASQWDSRVFAAVALHPTRTANFSESEQRELAILASAPRVVAIGETGLDYYWDYATPQAQQEAFRWHIDLAKQLDKALMIHDRDAHEDILRILAEEGAPAKVVFHCFSGDADFARRCVDAGYVLSFAGPLTFTNAKGLRAAAALVPDGQFLLETDAPFLTPHPYRGRPNEPYGVVYTAREFAALRGVDVAELADVSTATAQRVFDLGKHDLTS